MSQSDDLLVQLKKYRPGDHRTPTENYVTEAFAWLLEHSEPARQAVYCMIEGGGTVVVPEKISISTQEHFGEHGRPDMVWRWGANSCWVFEHKVWSSLHSGQLQAYRKFCEDRGLDHKIILITARQHQWEDGPDKKLCWEDIYTCLKNVLEPPPQNGASHGPALASQPRGKALPPDEVSKWAIPQVMALLESEGLGPPQPINPIAIHYYFEAARLESAVGDLVSRAVEHGWPLRDDGFFPLAVPERRWGRVGIEFSQNALSKPDKGQSWEPGVFCGFVLDGGDHKVSGYMKEPVAVLFVSFSMRAQRLMRDEPALLASLEEEVKRQQHGKDEWEGYGGIENEWHPICVMKPMSKLFEAIHGASKEVIFAEQVNVFQRAMSDLQTVLVECSAFQEIKKLLAPTEVPSQ